MFIVMTMFVLCCVRACRAAILTKNRKRIFFHLLRVRHVPMSVHMAWHYYIFAVKIGIRNLVLKKLNIGLSS
jgi:hypothetical protein